MRTVRLPNKNILMAVDASENSRQAVTYVVQMLGGTVGFKITLLHVISEPEEDYFSSEADMRTWLQNYKKKTRGMLNEYRDIMIQGGFEPDAVAIRPIVRYCPSLAECILSERRELDCETIVLGRQGLSRSEEFLFGSVSSKIVNHARDCTVWIVG